MGFGLTVFLDNWRTTVFDPVTQATYAILMGVFFIIVMIAVQLLHREVRQKKVRSRIRNTRGI